MLINESLHRQLVSKTILFDTCALGRIKINIKNPDVQLLLKEFGELKCPLAIHDLIKLEFLRDANKSTELAGRKSFIEALCQDLSLSVIPEQMYKQATLLSYIYVRYQLKNVGLVDLMTSVFLKQYSHKQGLILVTENNIDFPLMVHNRIGTVVLDLGKTLSTLGFYKIDETKWKNELSKLATSEEWKS